MTGCRIGTVRMKSGATIRVLPTPQRSHLHKSVEHFSECIEPDAHAVGFWVLYKDGTVSSGISREAGFTIAQCKGAFEHAKGCCIERIWGSE